MSKRGKIIALFDIDGTLTKPRNAITPEMKAFMQELRKHITVGIVGGSDHAKQHEQLGSSVVNDYDFAFAENGLVGFKDGKQFHVKSLREHFKEEQLQDFINWTLRYVADLNIPVKRGTFIEFRNGLINVSPIGRNCNQEERDAFEKYDEVHGVRAAMVGKMKERFASMDLTFSVGGQISFDVFPRGWDKTYCLQFVKDQFEEVHFFGDKTSPGGNDYEIFSSPLTIGHTVKGPEDTMEQCKKLFLS
eukprot:tig00000042_g15501.t1